MFLNQRRSEIKFYDKLKAQTESIHRQMVEAKRNETTNALIGVKHLCKEFSFTAGKLKGPLTSGRGHK